MALKFLFLQKRQLEFFKELQSDLSLQNLSEIVGQRRQQNFKIFEVLGKRGFCSLRANSSHDFI